jgi:hypothetical protein
LADLFRVNQTFQLVGPESAKLHPLDRLSYEFLLHGSRDQDLATVPGRFEPSRPIERRAVEVATARFDFTHVDPHPNPHVPDAAPVVASEGSLGGLGGNNGSLSRRK